MPTCRLGNASWTLAVLIVVLAALDSDGRRLRPDLGRAGVSVQPGDVGPVVGATRASAHVRMSCENLFDPAHAALLLALRSLRRQFPSAAGWPVEPGDLRDLRPLDEGHPGAADGDRDRVCADDHDRLSFPGAAVWRVGRSGHGRLAAVDAAALWPGPPDRHGYAGPLALGGDGAGVLERAQRTAGAAMAGRRRHPARPGVSSRR